jgi:Tat protein translocase TatB subunit
MLNIGPQELILVLLIALVVVGPKRLPELGRAIGRALNEFRKIQDDVKDTLKFDLGTDDGSEPYVRPEPNPPAAAPSVVDIGEAPEVSAPDGSATPNGSGTDAEPQAAE